MTEFELFHDVLHYDPNTGIFTWKQSANRSSQWNSAWAGKQAGCYQPVDSLDPSVKLSVYGKRYRAHRVAWFMMTGAWPEHEVDHKDRNPQNNTWNNLRACTSSQNKINRAGYGKLMKGVFPGKKGKFRAKLTYQGKTIHLGTYTTELEAHEAYVKKAREIWGDFVCGDKP